MSSVTGRIKEIKQPRGGYLNPKIFNVKQLEDSKVLNSEENIHASLVGLAVDYMTRFLMGADVKEAFSVSLSGALRAQIITEGKQLKEAKILVEQIIGLDDDSISFACKLVSFDVWARNPMAGPMSPTQYQINPDKQTIENIRIMVERSLEFWEKYGPLTADGFNFLPNGYTKLVDTGDGDYLTANTMWDFKVSNKDITNKHTLQLFMYWLMGKHSGNPVFNGVTNIGFFNPRLNKVYTLDMNTVSKDIIQIIEKEVIGY